MNRRLLWIALLCLGCTKSNGPLPGSQTHFLDACDGNCPSGLACLCGVCTVACDDGDDDAMCAEQADSATCSAAIGGDDACAGEGRVCDVECDGDRECSALGTGFACESGRCRARASAGGDAGTGAGGRAGASAGAGGRAGASAGAGGRAGAGGEPVPGADAGVLDAGPARPDAGADAGPLCSLPPEIGPCDAAIRRYYHDPDLGACREFTFGGCQGNANNFETQAECEAACDATPLPTGGGSCEVDGTVYPSGASGIDDPQSCNTCSCDQGQLICTEIACPEPCPTDTRYGMTCAQCGLAGGCSITRTGCLPLCDDETDCAATPGSACVDDICQLLCI
jgi:hypothetical protein